MTAKSNFLENELIDHVLGNLAYTPPASLFLALFTASPLDDGSGPEVSGGSYARRPITFGIASGGSSSNDAIVTFPVPPGAATAVWGSIADFAIFDALTVGNMLYYGAFTTAKIIDVDDIFEVLVGDLTVAEL